MTQETKYTVFNGAGFSWISSACAGWENLTLQELIDRCIERGYGAVAWAPGALEFSGHKYRDLREESIAAGRTIELVNGKYVARGIPEEKSDCAHVAAYNKVFTEVETVFLPYLKMLYSPELEAKTVQEWMEEQRQTLPVAEPKREPLAYFNERTPFDNFKGFASRAVVDFHCCSVKVLASDPRHPLQSSPDLAVDRIPFGSAHLLKG